MNLHPWLNALHIIAAIVWVGGILTMAVTAGWCSQRVNQQDPLTTALLAFIRRWSRRIVTPAMVILWGAGIIMIVAHGALPHLWLILKIMMVLLLSGLHGMLSGTLRKLASGERTTVPGIAARATPYVVVLLAVIIVLAVVRPV